MTLAQFFAEAPRREARAAAPASLAAAFTKRRRRRRKNVAVTAWDPSRDKGSAAPVYLVGALAGAEADAGDRQSLRLRLDQSAAQAQASRTPPTTGGGAAGGAVLARSCSAFFDPELAGGSNN